ncbi:MAG: hypothetical protein U0V74_03985 [Chitinophagales bacterium]
MKIVFSTLSAVCIQLIGALVLYDLWRSPRYGCSGMGEAYIAMLLFIPVCGLVVAAVVFGFTGFKTRQWILLLPAVVIAFNVTAAYAIGAYYSNCDKDAAFYTNHTQSHYQGNDLALRKDHTYTASGSSPCMACKFTSVYSWKGDTLHLDAKNIPPEMVKDYIKQNDWLKPIGERYADSTAWLRLRQK